LAIRPLLDDITLEALDECDYVALFGSGTLNFAKVEAVCPRKTFQSLSLIALAEEFGISGRGLAESYDRVLF